MDTAATTGTGVERANKEFRHRFRHRCMCRCKHTLDLDAALHSDAIKCCNLHEQVQVLVQCTMYTCIQGIVCNAKCRQVCRIRPCAVD